MERGEPAVQEPEQVADDLNVTQPKLIPGEGFGAGTPAARAASFPIEDLSLASELARRSGDRSESVRFMTDSRLVRGGADHVAEELLVAGPVFGIDLLDRRLDLLGGADPLNG